MGFSSCRGEQLGSFRKTDPKIGFPASGTGTGAATWGSPIVLRHMGYLEQIANFQDTATLWIVFLSMAVCSWPHIDSSSDYKHTCDALKTGRLGHKQS